MHEIAYNKKKSEDRMGILIIDGNSVFEIDENCIAKKKIPTRCNIEKYLRKDTEEESNESEDK